MVKLLKKKRIFLNLPLTFVIGKKISENQIKYRLQNNNIPNMRSTAYYEEVLFVDIPQDGLAA